MRFLIDRCAGSKLAAWLRQTMHDVLEARTMGPDPGDPELLRVAYELDRILVTIDTDFGALIFLEQRPHKGVVRLPDVPARRRIEIMRVVLERHAGDLTEGAIVTIRGDRIRISLAP